MKTFLVASFLVVVGAVSTAEAQSRQTFTAPTGDTRADRAERRAAPTRTRQAEGAFPRAARGGNFLQIFNPMAPQRYYGSVEDTVTYDPNDPKRVTGIILVGIRW